MYMSNTNTAKSRAIGLKYQKPEYKEERDRLVKLGKEIIEYIKNGVLEEEERVRPFDVIDFHLLTTFTIDEFYYIIRDDIDVSDQRIYRKFQQYNDLQNKINERILENYNLTLANGRKVTEEEKWYIFNMLQTYGFPLNLAFFNAAAVRICNGSLTMNNEKPKTLSLHKN